MAVTAPRPCLVRLPHDQVTCQLDFYMAHESNSQESAAFQHNKGKILTHTWLPHAHCIPSFFQHAQSHLEIMANVLFPRLSQGNSTNQFAS